jgi:hypothetical protein
MKFGGRNAGSKKQSAPVPGSFSVPLTKLIPAGPLSCLSSSFHWYPLALSANDASIATLSPPEETKRDPWRPGASAFASMEMHGSMPLHRSGGAGGGEGADVGVPVGVGVHVAQGVHGVLVDTAVGV